MVWNTRRVRRSYRNGRSNVQIKIVWLYGTVANARHSSLLRTGEHAPCFSTRYDPQGSVISQRIRPVQLIFAALFSEPFTLSLDFFMYVFIYTNFTGWLQFRRPGKPASLSWGTSRCHRRSHDANALLLDGIEHQNGALGANS